MDIKKEVSDAIYHVKVTYGLTINELTNVLNVAKSTLYRYMSGHYLAKTMSKTMTRIVEVSKGDAYIKARVEEYHMGNFKKKNHSTINIHVEQAIKAGMSYGEYMAIIRR